MTPLAEGTLTTPLRGPNAEHGRQHVLVLAALWIAVLVGCHTWMDSATQTRTGTVSQRTSDGDLWAPSCSHRWNAPEPTVLNHSTVLNRDCPSNAVAAHP